MGKARWPRKAVTLKGAGTGEDRSWDLRCYMESRFPGSRIAFHHSQSPFLLSASLSPPASHPTSAPVHQPFVFLRIRRHHRFPFLVFNLSLIGISIFQLQKECLCGLVTYADKSFGKHFLLLQQTALWRTGALATTPYAANEATEIRNPSRC